MGTTGIDPYHYTVNMTAPLQEPWQLALLQHIADRFASHEQLRTLQAAFDANVTAQQAAFAAQTTELQTVSNQLAAQLAATSATFQAHIAAFS